MNNREKIGEQVKSLRESRGFSVRQLADMCDVNFANICKIENGKYNVSVDILGKITDALGSELRIIDKAEG